MYLDNTCTTDNGSIKGKHVDKLCGCKKMKTVVSILHDGKDEYVVVKCEQHNELEVIPISEVEFIC